MHSISEGLDFVRGVRGGAASSSGGQSSQGGRIRAQGWRRSTRTPLNTPMPIKTDKIYINFDKELNYMD